MTPRLIRSPDRTALTPWRIDRLAARLRARPLLDEQELAAGVVLADLAQSARQL
jgi:hypothetical protein